MVIEIYYFSVDLDSCLSIMYIFHFLNDKLEHFFIRLGILSKKFYKVILLIICMTL